LIGRIANLKKWEYHIIKSSGYAFWPEDLEKEINALGNDGWEVIAVRWDTPTIFILKREKESSPSSRNF